jgi:hypothetical protein
VATSTASLFGLGDEITGLASLKGATLGVFCRAKIHLIAGSSATDWQRELHTNGAGAISNTVADFTGNALFLDDQGVLSLQSTQSFGDFESASLSSEYREFITERLDAVVGARRVKGSNQYRLYFTDRSVVRLTMLTGEPTPNPEAVAITRQEYLHTPACMWEGTIGGEEVMFFGTTGGQVMQEDKGTSFDGVAINYVALTAFNHFGSPDSVKRFHGIEFEMETPDPVNLRFRQLFDYDDGWRAHSATLELSTLGSGAQFNVGTFDTIRFDLPIHNRVSTAIAGTGNNMALLFVLESDYVRPFTLQGYSATYSLIGARKP